MSMRMRLHTAHAVPARVVRFARTLVGMAACLIMAGCVAEADRAQTDKPGDPASAGWQPLFDGKTLKNWQSTKFIGEGAVKVENGQLILEPGNDLTGITWTGQALPTTNYEIALQAMRVDGRDFFAGVTFPVDDSFCSLILGGWGGSVVGLSSINGMDASENQTSQSVEFESGRWYNIRIRVTPAAIEAWLDDRPIIKQELKGNKITTRLEMDFSQPLGVASFRTKSALRDIRLRRLAPA
jgi:hypothetical protein